MRKVVAFTFLFSVLYLHAQADGDAAGPRKELSAASLPSTSLTFSDPKLDSPLQLPDSVMSGPPRCGPDGRAFLQIMGPPPTYLHSLIYSITLDGKVTHYPVDEISGLTYVAVKAFDPGSSMPVMLLNATVPGAHSSGQYLALFKYDGELRKYSKLDLGFKLSNIAQLSDDSFLVIGADAEKAQSRFVVVDSNGNLLRDLDADKVMPSERKLKSMLQSLNFAGAKPEDIPPPARVYAVLSLFRTVHADQGLLVFMPGAGTEVVELLRSGEIHQMTLRLPQDQIPDSIITKKGRWFVRTYLRNTSSDWNLYEVDPETGEALQQINTSGVPATSIACPTDSGFYGLRWVEGKPYLIFGDMR